MCFLTEPEPGPRLPPPLQLQFPPPVEARYAVYIRRTAPSPAFSMVQFPKLASIAGGCSAGVPKPCCPRVGYESFQVPASPYCLRTNVRKSPVPLMQDTSSNLLKSNFSKENSVSDLMSTTPPLSHISAAVGRYRRTGSLL